MVKAIQLEYEYLLIRNKELREGFHVGLSIVCSSIGRHLSHVDDAET
jgi:hypothetical protein